MQSERDSSQSAAGPPVFRGSLALKVLLHWHSLALFNSGRRFKVHLRPLLQALLSTDIPAWAQACITQSGTAMGGTGTISQTRQQTRTIWHGEPAGELHVEASGPEEYYWNEVQVHSSTATCSLHGLLVLISGEIM